MQVNMKHVLKVLVLLAFVISTVFLYVLLLPFAEEIIY